MHSLPACRQHSPYALTTPLGKKKGRALNSEPQAQLDQPAAVVQVLVALVALVLDAHQHQRHEPEEQLHIRRPQSSAAPVETGRQWSNNPQELFMQEGTVY